jgi:hypothetical protein
LIWNLTVIPGSTFAISTDNTAPYFINLPLVDQTVQSGALIAYVLPQYKDDQGNAVYVSASYPDVVSFTSFVNSNTFVFQPSSSVTSGSYVITVTLKDNGTPPKSNIYTFTLTIVQPKKTSTTPTS